MMFVLLDLRESLLLVDAAKNVKFKDFYFIIIGHMVMHFFSFSGKYLNDACLSVLVEETKGCYVSCFTRVWGKGYLDFWAYFWKRRGI